MSRNELILRITGMLCGLIVMAGAAAFYVATKTESTAFVSWLAALLGNLLLIGCVTIDKDDCKEDEDE